MIYRQSPRHYHSSAGVKIVLFSDGGIDTTFIGLNRELNNVRKSLIVANVEIPLNVDLTSIKCLEKILVSHLVYRYRRPEGKKIG